jgi:hypothetical protein
MILFGPVSNPDHISPWFPILLGAAGLICTWVKYARGELREGTHPRIILGINAICTVLIIIGLWDVLR